MNQDSSLRVLFVVNSFSGGGAEKSMFTITKNFSKDRFDVHLCALNVDSSDWELTLPSNFHKLERKWKSGLAETFANLILFRKLLLDIKPQVIVANCELPELFVALAAPKSVSLIIVEHTSQPWNGRKSMGYVVRKFLNFRKATWVTVSKDSNKIWLGSKNPLHIPNPIIIREKLNCQVTPFTQVVFVGRLRPEKRPHLAIEASIRNNLRIDLFGDGFLGEQLKSQYSSNSSLIRFHGHISNPWNCISKNSIIVVPSEYEGDGMVVAEAILMNFSILLSDNFDLRRFNLPDINYFEDLDDLTEKLKLWEKSDSEIFRAPKDLAANLKRERSLEGIINQWESLLKGVI